jgi:hypothetical protein
VRGKALQRDLEHVPAGVSVAELTHLVEDRVRVGSRIVDDATVGEERDASAAQPRSGRG